MDSIHVFRELDGSEFGDWIVLHFKETGEEPEADACDSLDEAAEEVAELFADYANNDNADVRLFLCAPAHSWLDKRGELMTALDLTREEQEQFLAKFSMLYDALMREDIEQALADDAIRDLIRSTQRSDP